jgi:transcriptional regulator with XRE-family HTH domain
MRNAQKTEPPKTAAAERMLRLRTALADSQVEFCARYGFKVPQWSNFENGRPVGKAAALKLVRQIHGLSLDWVYLGNSSGLTMEMAKRLGELPTGNRSGS